VIHTHSLNRAARCYPDWPAMADAGSRSSFKELHERVGDVAAMLRDHDFAVGDRLAVLLPNRAEYIELVYACAWLGVTVVPLNTRLSAGELDHILADASPRGLIRSVSLPAPTVKVPWELVLDDARMAVPRAAHPDAIYDPDAILTLIYTSGTTGRAKGVVQSHANILASLHHLNYWMPYREGGVFLHAAPMFHIMDFPFLFAAPAFGARQATIPKFSPQGFCEAVERERVTRTLLVPTMLNMLVQFADLKRHDLSSLAEVGYGGSPVAPALIRRVRELFPHVKLVQGYGLTETGFLTGLRDEDHTDAKLMSCGRACPGIDVQVVDESGKEVDVGQPGELAARGANVMRGYWNDEDDTARSFRNGLFRTGDVGYRDADGYFYIQDRAKDLIVTGGEKVASAEVEAVIYELPAVREVAVFGSPDPQWGERVTACVVLKPGTSLTADELSAHCRQSLAGFKCPRRIEFSSAELPKDAAGKVLKRELRDGAWAQQPREVG
jgi:acyl-CoA synthetase (AMP-forming)/AMP-acid ligase II